MFRKISAVEHIMRMTGHSRKQARRIAEESESENSNTEIPEPTKPTCPKCKSEKIMHDIIGKRIDTGGKCLAVETGYTEWSCNECKHAWGRENLTSPAFLNMGCRENVEKYMTEH